jgi:hypothetical protein
MNQYSNDELSFVIKQTANALTEIVKGLDNFNEAMKLMVDAINSMNDKLNEKININIG